MRMSAAPLSHQFPWQATFYAITAIGAAGVLALIPPTPKPKTQRIGHEFAAFGDARVLLAMGITILGPAAFFTSITYIA